MAACDYCGATILWGGARNGDFVFCNEKCRAEGVLVTLIDQIPPEIAQERLAQVHQGNCPACGGEGPIDVHTSYSATSALVMTWWNSKPKVCCRRCGIKGQIGGLLWSGVLGWWGLSVGVDHDSDPDPSESWRYHFTSESFRADRSTAQNGQLGIGEPIAGPPDSRSGLP